MVIFLSWQSLGDVDSRRGDSSLHRRNFAVMYLLGYSLNILSLMALTLSVASSSTTPS